ncbi:MAG: hypothetical protein AB1757_08350 [Acidobacteriota bacterium]
MKSRTRDFIPLIALTLVALLTLPNFYYSRQSAVKANAQDTSKSDIPPKTKQKRPTAPSGVTVAPANDNCAGAINVTTSPFTDTQDTAMATDEMGEPQSTCTLQANSVWYTISGGTGKGRTVSVSTCTSGFDTAIMVWQVNGAACDFANFAAVACNDDFCGDGLQSTVIFTAQPNTTYKIQIGGFDGETGSLTTDITFEEKLCDDIVINGTLGSGSQDFEGVQTSGNQLGRLNRNGVSSTCAAPKPCLIFDAAGLRAFDAYSIPNDSGEDACVSVMLSEPAAETCNLQSNAYLNSYDPNNICTNYLADPGLSTGVPPTPTTMSFIVPAGQTLIVVVHTTNPGESGCPYTLTVGGTLCRQFDYCVQDTSNPSRFILINSTTGAYEYHDCSKGVVLAGTGVVGTFACKIQLFDSGPNPKKSDRSVSVLINPCTFRGDASVRGPGVSGTVLLGDTDINNNDCACVMAAN